MIHSGSRGLGHQVATDALVAMETAMARDGLITNDRQLACARINSQVSLSMSSYHVLRMYITPIHSILLNLPHSVVFLHITSNQIISLYTTPHHTTFHHILFHFMPFHRKGKTIWQLWQLLQIMRG